METEYEYGVVFEYEPVRWEYSSKAHAENTIQWWERRNVLGVLVRRALGEMEVV